MRKKRAEKRRKKAEQRKVQPVQVEEPFELTPLRAEEEEEQPAKPGTYSLSLIIFVLLTQTFCFDNMYRRLQSSWGRAILNFLIYSTTYV